jgi:replicative DNA helicase
MTAYQNSQIPPQAKDLEAAVLGALLIDRDAINIVMDILSPGDFYDPSHEIIYNAIVSLFDKMLPIDILTVTEKLKQAGNLEKAGGAYAIVELANKVASGANVEFHARIIAQKSIQRGLISLSNQTLRKAMYDVEDVFDLLEETEKGLFSLTKNGTGRDFQNADQVTAAMLRQMKEFAEDENGLTGVGTGIKDLDSLTSGWQNSDLFIIAARPGMGKTGLALTLAKNAAALYGKRVAVFSLEMSAVQLNQRLVSMEAGVSVSKIRNPRKLSPQDWEKISPAAEFVSGLSIAVDDTASLNIFQLRSKARRLKMQQGLDLIIVDYLQLMSGRDDRNRNRENEVSEISRGLKILAKELNVPVLALSQLSRAVETRGGSKRPQLSDLRESGAIEQDADGVMFIYRPWYYHIKEDMDGHSTKRLAELIIAKHRNGPLETVKSQFTDYTTSFSNYPEDDQDDGFDPLPALDNDLSKHSPDPDEDLPF